MKGQIASCVRAYINRLECDELFTTNELLVFGNRAAVDQVLWRLTKLEYIKRIGNGVFLKCDRLGRFRNVSAEEAIKKKASVSGKRIVVHRTKEGIEFLTNGRPSTIVINGETYKLKKACNRKLNLGESKAGSLLRQFWFEGKIQAETIWQDGTKINRFQILNARDRDELREAAPLIPDWLNEVVNKKHFGRFLNKDEKTKFFKRLQLLHRD